MAIEIGKPLSFTDIVGFLTAEFPSGIPNVTSAPPFIPIASFTGRPIKASDQVLVGVDFIQLEQMLGPAMNQMAARPPLPTSIGSLVPGLLFNAPRYLLVERTGRPIILPNDFIPFQVGPVSPEQPSTPPGIPPGNPDALVGEQLGIIDSDPLTQLMTSIDDGYSDPTLATTEQRGACVAGVRA